VVGGGLGDIEEVLAAGRRLARARFRVVLYRRPARPWPRSVDGPWAWPAGMERSRRLTPRAGAAITIAPAWGVSAAPPRAGPLGGPGPWAEEVAEIESRYGPDRVLHVSLEEFARTLTGPEENRERLREGGVPLREIAGRVGRPEGRRAEREMAAAYRRFRAFDRRNVLHVFATFSRRSAFAREHPRAVQTGPLLSGARPARPTPRRPHPRWVWYASPASAERIAPSVFAAASVAPGKVRLFVRSPRAWPTVRPPRGVEIRTEPLPAATWRRRFADADLRIVTGSRTLLEALEGGGPFLYFNGILGDAGAVRRHRPEKLRGLLRAARRSGWPADLRRDLADFARGRRVGEVIGRAARREGGWARPPSPIRASGFSRPFHDAGALLVAVARDLARPGTGAPAVVERWRRRSNA
jgi:hypothetical protein